MDFLANTIISEDTGGILGLLLTHFDVDDYTSRASVKLYNMEDFAEALPALKPVGFVVQQDGSFVSDSVIRKTITSSVFSYMEKECSGLGRVSKDITDLVLFGAENQGFVVANYETYSQHREEVSPILIPFKNFRVSNSSFNIYASYLTETNVYRTFSLLELEDGSSKDIFVAFPQDIDLSGFGPHISVCDSLINSDIVLTVYKVHLGISPFYISVGEAFLNYLAYNIAFYNIGEKVLKELAPTVPVVTSTEYKRENKQVRRPRVNVGIEHTYRKSCLEEIKDRLSNINVLQQYIQEVPEAAITYQWIVKAYNSPWFNEARVEDENSRLEVSCMNLLRECRLERLKFSIELLTHRYYIYSGGFVNDSLGNILSGGGVSGSSVKRFDFGYN